MNSQVRKAIADLKVQSMIFGMDVDLEAGTLVPKRPDDATPIWIRRWRENRENSDFDEYIDIDRSDDE